jgi:futalosine hydrolase
MLILVPTALELRGVFPEIASGAAQAPALWLRRTSFGDPAWVARCGLGLSAAGARAAALWSRLPGDACLAGLAGTLDPDRAPVGSLVLASSVEVEGIGFGEEAAFVHPSRCGGALQAEWEASPAATPWTPPLDATIRRAPLLSVASSSGSAAHAALRRERHPGCLVEEMEADAVLHAAAALSRRLVVLRAACNVAGDREPTRWRVPQALASLRETLDAWLRP